MELKEFIKTVLTDITDAVSELQAELQNGAIVSPSMPNSIKDMTVLDPSMPSNHRLVSNIEFNVAITAGAVSESKAEGKAGLKVLSGNIGTAQEERTENVSRISF